MATTTTNELGDTIPTIIEEAQVTRQFKAIMRALSWPIKKGKGSNINVPYMNEFTSNQLQENVDITTSETMLDTNVQITPVEHGLKGVLSKNVVEDDNEDLIRMMGGMIGDAYEKELDILLLRQLDDATNSLAGAGTTMTMGHIAAARALLAGNPTSAGGPAPMPYATVIHPFQELDIVDVLTPLLPAGGTTQSAAGGFADEVLRNYSIGRLFGMPVVIDGNLEADTADDVKGGVFATGKRGALIYGWAREPKLDDTWDASLRGWELVYVGRYGVGEFRPGWIAELYTDAATPA